MLPEKDNVRGVVTDMNNLGSESEGNWWWESGICDSDIAVILGPLGKGGAGYGTHKEMVSMACPWPRV